jgi:cyanophycin synthetase
MASSWNDRRVTGVITIQGDRDDAIIDRAARAAAQGFNKLIVREDHDLRGRQPGDVANIVFRAVREVAPATECEVVLDETEALRRAVSRMIKNEVIVVFYEKLQPIQQMLQELLAEPVIALPPPVKQSPRRRRPPSFGKQLVPVLTA